MARTCVVHLVRFVQRAWEKRGLVAGGAVVAVLAVAAPAVSQGGGPPPDDPAECPSHDETVVVLDGRAYRWASFDGPDIRLVSYSFKPGTFPANPLSYENTYPQSKYDIDWGWGCLSVAVPQCGQVDTTTITLNPPGTLSWEFALQAIRNGDVLPGTALLGDPDTCGCPDVPPPGGDDEWEVVMDGNVARLVRAQSGGNPPVDPCEPTTPPPDPG
jgi:hypothetical protein